MGMRERLIELLKGTPDVWMAGDSSEMIADHLIANGVTIKKYEEIDFDYAAED